MPNPTLFYWNRIEGRPRSTGVYESLAARVRDPLWYLHRQWQLGEFAGFNAGSLAFIQYTSDTSLLATMTSGSNPQAQGISLPIEKMMLAESAGPSLMDRAEMGQRFSADLNTAFTGLSTPLPSQLVSSILAALQKSLSNPTPPPSTLPSPYLLSSFGNLDDDRDAQRFVAACGPQALDGYQLYLDIAGNKLPLSSVGALQSSAQAQQLWLAFQLSYCNWVITTYPEIFAAAPPPLVPAVTDPKTLVNYAPVNPPGEQDSPSWDASDLTYTGQIYGVVPGGSAQAFTFVPDTSGQLDWASFDISSGPALSSAAVSQIQSVSVPSGSTAGPLTCIVPTHVRFQGMPGARWWDFETANLDFGKISADPTDLGKLLLMDFMLIHGHNWYVFPHDQPVGSLGRIGTITATDVFGKTFQINRADAEPQPAGRRWTLFSTDVAGPPPSTGGDLPPPGDFLLVAPSASVFMHSSQPIEQVEFIRDNMADLVWAVEKSFPGLLGRARSGYERQAALNTPSTVPPPSAQSNLEYRLQNRAPNYWYPFIPTPNPQSPLSPPPPSQQAAPYYTLQSGEMLYETDGAASSRILNPSSVASNSIYTIPDHKVPSLGLSIMRRTYRTRWTDGSVHLWVARDMDMASTTGTSGLRFDEAEPVESN